MNLVLEIGTEELPASFQLPALSWMAAELDMPCSIGRPSRKTVQSPSFSVTAYWTIAHESLVTEASAYEPS